MLLLQLPEDAFLRAASLPCFCFVFNLPAYHATACCVVACTFIIRPLIFVQVHARRAALTDHWMPFSCTESGQNFSLFFTPCHVMPCHAIFVYHAHCSTEHMFLQAAEAACAAAL